MTLRCHCPECGRVCGFKDACAGRRARCLHCNGRFIIPAGDDEPARPVTAPPPEPLPGFYHAVLRETWTVFVQPESRTGLILCAALTAFHFFIGDTDYSVSLPGFRLQAPLGAMYRMSVATASISRIRSDGERPPTVLFNGRTRL